MQKTTESTYYLFAITKPPLYSTVVKHEHFAVSLTNLQGQVNKKSLDIFRLCFWMNRRFRAVVEGSSVDFWAKTWFLTKHQNKRAWQMNNRSQQGTWYFQWNSKSFRLRPKQEFDNRNISQKLSVTIKFHRGLKLSRDCIGFAVLQSVIDQENLYHHLNH